MRILSLDLTYFRCFNHKHLEFANPIVALSGQNGAGKTSILEALHYVCYLKSFRASHTRELIQLNAQGYTIKVTIASDPVSIDTLTVAYAPPKRTVKVNTQAIRSFKELYGIYRAITITEDDLLIITGSPGLRRAYLDQLATLLDPSYTKLLYKYRQVLDNRNALLAHYAGDRDLYTLWTDQLFALSRQIQIIRIELIEQLQSLIESEHTLIFTYKYAHSYALNSQETSQQLLTSYPELLKQELQQQRSLFGAHLDDFDIIFQEKKARFYASRGQQKLIIFLLKLAQIRLFQQKQIPIIVLIDDFLTDLDTSKASLLLSIILPLASQTIITTPAKSLFLESELARYQAEIIIL